MLVALDVHYDDVKRKGTAAAVVFERWEDSIPLTTYVANCSNIQPYVPGDFFKRELPCLQAMLAMVNEPLTLAIVDGFVALGAKPGMGMRLWEALQMKIPVIGVAKTRFRSANCTEVFRGSSKTPLYVTAGWSARPSHLRPFSRREVGRSRSNVFVGVFARNNAQRHGERLNNLLGFCYPELARRYR